MLVTVYKKEMLLKLIVDVHFYFLPELSFSFLKSADGAITCSLILINSKLKLLTVIAYLNV